MNAEHPKLEWLKKYKLTTGYKPIAWINALLVLERKIGDPKMIVVIDDCNKSTRQELQSKV